MRGPNPRWPTASVLAAIKTLHTLVWLFFVTCILAIWLFAWTKDFALAALAIGCVSIEVVVLAANRWRCPLSMVAARYTEDRRANFDIYLPAWLAGHTAPIFGPLYGAGVVFTLAMAVLKYR